MAKPLACDSIMAPGKMKPLLALSKREPIQAAFVLSTDGEAMILLDKKAKPRAVAGMLKAAAGKAKIALNSSSVRFGRAEVDPDYDPGTVRFFINKDAPGVMRVRLTEVIKRVPYQKVEINVDPSLEEEEGPGEEAAGDGAVAEPTAAAAAAAAEAVVPDAAAVRAGFAAAIGKIAGAAGPDAGRLSMLKGLAAEVGGLLKAGDVAGAAAALAGLQREIEAGGAGTGTGTGTGAGAGAPGGGGEAVRVAKGLLLWNATRSHVDKQLKTLEAAILEQSRGEPDFEEIRSQAGVVHEILERLDDSLTESLNALRGATDAAEKVALSGEAKRVVAGFRSYVDGDPLMADIDDNGFVALDIKARVSAALDAVMHVL